jgi:protein-S-isoprenylcysteine O-methyltransferase Ste14
LSGNIDIMPLPREATDPSAPDFADRGPGVRLPPTVAFAVGFLIALGLHGFEPIQFLTGRHVSALMLVGWTFVLTGAGLFLWSLRVFFLARTGIMLQKPATALMRQGPYARSRNPQYLAFAAIYIGAALVTNTVWPLLFLAPVLMIVFHTVIRREERYLRRTFGAEYVAYCRDVGRWL